jgi:putative PIN family toxin of toxin-antitoxin system
VRVLLDTNVWIAGLIAHGTCAELIEYCIGRHPLPISDWMLREVAEKLATRFNYPPGRVREVESWLQDICEPFVLKGEPPTVCRDPDDNYVLLSARQAEAACIVTGDKDLLVPKRYAGIPVVAPNAFWRLERLLERGQGQ